MKARWWLGLSGVLVWVVPTAAAQSTETKFEVASVRPGPGDNGRTGAGLVGIQGSRWVAENVPLMSLIRAAYGHEYPLAAQIVGGPAWLRSARFTVIATAGRVPTEAEARLMLQHLLKERFGLAVHVENRNLPVFALTLVRDGQFGSDLRPVPVDCDARRAAWTRGEIPRPTARPGSPLPDCSPTAFWRTSEAVTATSGGLTMEQLASELSSFADRPVIDRTGLKGFFGVDLKFQRSKGATALTDTPPLAVALRVRLGLQLVPLSEPYDVLVIDTVQQQPTEN